ncbi:hypothetical protein [Propionivibrio sp.]|uniref:hypothetical protein n=1 Tax=Propionivibrio sp. TaxID=2212460 RepID=UPI003BF1AF5B
MTIRFTDCYEGYYTGQLVSLPNPEDEAAIVALGFATTDLDGPDGSAARALIEHAAEHVNMGFVAALNALHLDGTGVPENAVQAALTVNPAGDDNSLTFTAVAYGAGGNAITIEYVDPGAASASLGVVVSGPTITVNLATDVNSAITSTAAEVLTAIEASTAAVALITVAIDTSDAGNADDGSGVVTAMAVDTFAGGAGTGVGLAKKGCEYVNTTTGLAYRNTGTLAVPVWTGSVTTAAFASTSSTVNALSALHLFGSGAPVDYTDGTPLATGEGVAVPNALYSDITTNGSGGLWRNSGTQAQPVWTQLADAA